MMQTTNEQHRNPQEVATHNGSAWDRMPAGVEQTQGTQNFYGRDSEY